MAVIEYVVVGDLLKAYSLALCCSILILPLLVSLPEDGSRVFIRTLNYFLLVMILGQYFLDKKYFLYLKVHLPFSHFPSLK